MMHDTDTTSHAAAAIDAIEDLRHYNGNDDAYHAALRNVRALAANADALHAYALRLESMLRASDEALRAAMDDDLPEANVSVDDVIGQERYEAGVTGLMDR